MPVSSILIAVKFLPASLSQRDRYSVSSSLGQRSFEISGHIKTAKDAVEDYLDAFCCKDWRQAFSAYKLEYSALLAEYFALIHHATKPL